MTNAEIDRMIAEKVMGWKLICPDGYAPFWETGGEKRSMFEFTPSTNIAHAFEALESFGVAWELYKTDVSDYSCNIYDNQKQCFINGGYAKTKEMAICLAIIQAVKDRD